MAEPATKVKPLPLWSRAALTALLILVLILPVAVGFNAAFGRVIHWDIVSLLAGGGFLGLTVLIRYSR